MSKYLVESGNGGNNAAKCATISEQSVFDKIAHCFRKAGRELVENVLILFYALPEASPTDAAIIVGALAYFLLPIDAIPDILPGGYVDDLGVILGAVARIRASVSSEVKARAKRKADEWFGK